MKYSHILLLVLILLIQPTRRLWSEELPITFSDFSGQKITLAETPQRVVSLVPSITEILMRIGAGDSVVGITTHDVRPVEVAQKTLVGGFLNPDMNRVAALQPDVIFYADLHQKALSHQSFKAKSICLVPRTLAEGFADIRLLGRIFYKESRAEALIAEEQRQLEVIAAKVAKIPLDQRQRAIRLMGMEPLTVPGDDSFQNEYIRAAGGIAPHFGKDGQIIPVTPAEWQNFNPQVIYSCGRPETVTAALQQPGLREVDAVRNGRIFFFPCELTCRLASYSGFFVSWLAASIYGEQFSHREQYVQKEEVVSREPLTLDLASIKNGEIITSNIGDFHNKTLLLTLRQPMRIVSTLEGQRSGISFVANHFFPPPAWGLSHGQGVDELRKTSEKVLDLNQGTTAMLFTGADMDNLAVVRKSYREMEVVALVTAGVEGNAMRMGVDTGSYYEPEGRQTGSKPGTINILLISNMQLSPRAMTQAIITATEGKTAALQDLGIRSSFSGEIHAATGTGTDNIIVIENVGTLIDAAGGHTKMGELIARAVYEGVREAIGKQNGLAGKRSIFKQLEERKIHLEEIWLADRQMRSCIEHLLLDGKNASFMQAALAISDEYERGLVTDLSAFDTWCQVMADSLVGTSTTLPVLSDTKTPKVIGKALAVFIVAGKAASK
ncbi:MAG: helical backbone metal receptor [Pseudomonadota bacterium]